MTVNGYLHDDTVKPASQLVGNLLDSYRVVLYNGMYDFDCNIIGTLDWLG